MHDDIKKVCCFTGHRDIPKSLVEQMRNDVDFEIEKHYIMYGVDTFISGGAIGFDLLAAEAVVQAKRRHPDIKLVFVLPCADHSKKWNDADITKLRVLCLYADEVITLSDSYYRGCMHQRNKFMLEHSTYCISYCKKSSGGTYFTLNLAKRLNKIITEL